MRGLKHKMALAVVAALATATSPAAGRGAEALGAPPDLGQRLTVALRSATADPTTTTASTRSDGLRALLDEAPDYAPARAELGEIHSRDGWAPVAKDQRLAIAAGLHADYESRRSTLDGTPRDHARLAAWCTERGLVAEARPHWLAVLANRPADRAALNALGLVYLDGRHQDRDLVDANERRTKASELAAKRWDRRLERLEKRRVSRLDLDRFREDVDREAIGPIERRLAAAPALRDEDRASRRRKIGAAFVAGSRNEIAPEMTASLCRIAIHAPDEVLRDKAANALIDRPRFDTIPMLLANLRSPIQSEHRVSSDRTGNVIYQHNLLAEGAEVDQAIHRRYVRRVGLDGLNRLGSTDQMVEALYRSQFETLRNLAQLTSEAERVEAQLAAYNRAAEQSNERVIGALQRVTQESLGDHPRAWWDYWQRYSGYDLPDARPIRRQYDTADTTRWYTPEPPPRCECFVAGTPVWTRTGRQPIETVERGDLVLARDPHRGGLTYRVVTGTTLREPSPMVALTLRGETIHATEGHPFWVVNRGWRMAKQLVVGDVLSTLEGPTAVEGTEPTEALPAHNLIVESAANYYVGERGVLVHDNTPRRPTVGLVAVR